MADLNLFNSRKCPVCGFQVQFDSTKCIYCGANLESEVKKEKKSPLKLLLILSVVILLIGLFVTFLILNR